MNIDDFRKPLLHEIIYFFIFIATVASFMAEDLNEIIVTPNENREPIILDGYGCNCRVNMIPDKPTVGERVKIIFTLTTPYKNIPEYRVKFNIIKGAVLEKGNLLTVYPGLKKGDSSLTSIYINIASHHLIIAVNAHAHIADPYSRNEWSFFLSGKMTDILLFKEGEDLSYEKYGNDSEIWPRIGPEYLYDIVAGERMPSVGHVAKEAQEIRNEIEALQIMDSTMTDWEALEMLHDAIAEMIICYGIHEKNKSITILLIARELMRSENIKKWDAVEKIINEMKLKR